MAGNNIDTLALGRKGVVIHNDAGSASATAKSYEWMKDDYNRLSQGFAHTYIDEHDRVYIRPDNQTAWHTATFEGNEYYMGVEVCQSMGDEAQFLRNEQATFKYVAEYMKAHGMTPNRETVRLHKEFSSTACPHRSWDLHGKDVNAVKDYFISQIKKYMNGNVAETAPVQQAQTKDTTFGRIDYKDTDKQVVRFRGWGFNTRLQPNKKEDLVAEAYTLFLIDAQTGAELTRKSFHPAYRDDVANAFPQYKNVGYGAFDVTFNVDPKWNGKTVFPMLRFSGVDTNFAKVDDIYYRGDLIQI